MQENLITFETAKLAKEKGYKNHDCKKYDSDGLHAIYGFVSKGTAAPTQSLLQKWLRDIHKIHIEPQLSRNSQEEYKDWWFYLYPNLSGGRIKFFPSEIGEGLSYEKALEIGLQEALKLIPDKK